jgi:hypothetical protein
MAGCFIAIAVSFAFIRSYKGRNLGQVYKSHRTFTASRLPNLIANIKGVFPHKSN